MSSRSLWSPVAVVDQCHEYHVCVTITRREMMVGTAAAVLLRSREAQAQPLAFDVPAGACDCHTHLFGDPARFPFWSGRTYTPPASSVAEWQSIHRTLHIDRGIIVQPSVYGTDNRCTLDAIQQLGNRARGVAVVADDATGTELDALHRGGVRGVRLNLETFGIGDPSAASEGLRRALAPLAHRPWHVQLFVRSAIVATIEPAVRDSPLPIVFDHFGGIRADAGPNDPGFQALLRLVRAGKAYVKVSGAYRASVSGAPDYADVRPFARALIEANPARILWGSDWPHPDSRRHDIAEISPNLRVDDVAVLNQLAIWAPDASVRRAILVDNPARLYGF
jgi:predicted TIM-barrel fold metal-dependent hydrolase